MSGQKVGQNFRSASVPGGAQVASGTQTADAQAGQYSPPRDISSLSEQARTETQSGGPDALQQSDLVAKAAAAMGGQIVAAESADPAGGREESFAKAFWAASGLETIGEQLAGDPHPAGPLTGLQAIGQPGSSSAAAAGALLGGLASIPILGAGEIVVGAVDLAKELGDKT
ncbi:MAG: hypothetical protein KGR26_02140 [Cyanobacteria bacterium REEB65]|nr:hypothetical protein [Cyanobacteria bacterium REEB65]